ncbi:MAG: hypothetical protein J6T57_02850 [Alphaproteobacteria bacterium]|nr:hypothetical protein [Alphaproteobacteria bacterium]
MRIRILPFVIGLCALNTGVAHANWQYSGEYTYDMGYYDNGERVAVSLRGGATYAMSKMAGDANSIIYSFCVDPATGAISDYDGTCADGMVYSTGALNSLGLEKLSGFGFTAGASIGWVLPDSPQWRLELGWDHFSEIDYNETPLFSGNMPLTGGYVLPNFEVGSVQSTLATDIISVMAFYDMFSGLVKPAHQLIPYIGLGVGYADSKTVMSMFDYSGNLSEFEILQDFGDSSGPVLHFYKSTTNTNNIAGVAALGVSYGLNSNLYVDFGARVAYLPRIKYQLVNSDDTRRMDWFSAKNLIYANVVLGVRLEF